MKSCLCNSWNWFYLCAPPINNMYTKAITTAFGWPESSGVPRLVHIVFMLKVICHRTATKVCFPSIVLITNYSWLCTMLSVLPIHFLWQFRGPWPPAVSHDPIVQIGACTHTIQCCYHISELVHVSLGNWAFMGWPCSNLFLPISELPYTVLLDEVMLT